MTNGQGTGQHMLPKEIMLMLETIGNFLIGAGGIKEQIETIQDLVLVNTTVDAATLIAVAVIIYLQHGRKNNNA